MSFFSNTNTSGGGGGIFGSNTSGTTTTNPTGNSNPPTNLFGGGSFGTPASRTTSTPQTGGNLFGGNTATSTTPSTGTGLFGGASTTPAAPTPNGLFSLQNNTNPVPNFGSSGGNLFGGGASNTPSTGTGLFGGANTSTPAPAAGTSLFGTAPSTSTPAANAQPGSLFGAANTSTSATDASKTAAAPTNTLFGAKPATIFGQPASTTGTGTGAAPAPASTTPSLGGGLFGLPPKPAATAPATGATSGASNLNLFGQAIPAKTTPETTNAPASTPATGTSLFGAPASKEGEKKDAATPTAAPAFNLFGGAKPAEKKAETPAPSTDKKDGPATSTVATASIAIAPPSMLRGKSLEEIVNRWTIDLEANIREFNKFAAEVSVWDRALIENGNNIASLYSHILAAERQQNDINESLEHIEQQQKELATTLDAYEKVSQDILGGQSGNLRTLDTGPADNERDKNYMLATDLHTHLDDLSGSLTQMIDSVNALSIASKPSESADDPMSQISQILSSHLESLQWIDSAVRDVESKTNDVENRIKDSGHNLSGPVNRSRGFGLNR